MMTIQNFGFFVMYFGIWLTTPSEEVCAETRFSEGFMALVCFLVAFLCIGMGFGGYIDDEVTFAFYWIAHAIPAVFGYTTCTFLVPMARFSETGEACAALAPVAGSAIQAVFILEAGLYWCYVGNSESAGPQTLLYSMPALTIDSRSRPCVTSGERHLLLVPQAHLRHYLQGKRLSRSARAGRGDRLRGAGAVRCLCTVAGPRGP